MGSEKIRLVIILCSVPDPETVEADLERLISLLIVDVLICTLVELYKTSWVVLEVTSLALIWVEELMTDIEEAEAEMEEISWLLLVVALFTAPEELKVDVVSDPEAVIWLELTSDKDDTTEWALLETELVEGPEVPLTVGVVELDTSPVFIGAELTDVAMLELKLV